MSEIIILGAGPSAMITALGLASKNIKSRIFEKNTFNEEFFQNDIRNFALTEFSIRFFQEINIWGSIEKYAVSLQTVYIVDNKSPNILELTLNGSGILSSNSLGYMIKSSDLRRQLFKLIKNNPLIEINDQLAYKNVEFGKYDSEIILDNDAKIKADLIIATDGKQSLLRKKYFKDFINYDYKQTALIFNIKHEYPHDQSALEHFLPNGCFAVLPLIDPHESSIVWSENSDCANILTKLDNESLVAHLYERAGYSYGKIEITSKIASYPLSASLSDKYYFNNIVLASDAAHTMHPLAGQGLNQGIKDIESLTKLIHNRLRLGLELDSYMLSEYENSRKLDNIKMFRITHYLDMIFSNNIPILSGSRKLGLCAIDNIKPIREFIMKKAMMI
jgi:2-octaprenyl-6-methoxyphenol hydroxylase